VPFSVKETGDELPRQSPCHSALTGPILSSRVGWLSQGHRCLPSGDATLMMPQPRSSRMAQTHEFVTRFEPWGACAGAPRHVCFRRSAHPPRGAPRPGMTRAASGALLWVLRVVIRPHARHMPPRGHPTPLIFQPADVVNGATLRHPTIDQDRPHPPDYEVISQFPSRRSRLTPGGTFSPDPYPLGVPLLAFPSRSEAGRPLPCQVIAHPEPLLRSLLLCLPWRGFLGQRHFPWIIQRLR
jgi:hypothetical protein